MNAMYYGSEPTSYSMFLFSNLPRSKARANCMYSVYFFIMNEEKVYTMLNKDGMI